MYQCHALQLGQAGLNQVPPVTQPGTHQVSGNPYGKQVQGGEMKERKGQNGSWAGKRGRSEEVRAVRNKQT